MEGPKPAGGDAYSSVVQRLQRLYMVRCAPILLAGDACWKKATANVLVCSAADEGPLFHMEGGLFRPQRYSSWQLQGHFNCCLHWLSKELELE